MPVYVSGPMSKRKDYNFPKFHAVAAELRAQGKEVVNPAELAHNDDLTKDWSFYVREDLRAMLDCDEIVLLPGWRGSKGARLELRVAKALGMRVTEWA
ncbi:hypothetical protein PBI_GAIA_125 [Mycobacterium phage Gaia]|uniref:DUF4406 domain-containing protein n=1 Tax=Mycobacterium phage Gaia TaxID=1486472 RepID=A0A068F2J4_9CAUD|nr:nucleoside 2-deoxyribosyltransferase [Mycobacterium phage Gaia]AID58944.1 hypothetical protein PBI_GAIA_125 [Mycobacterium phage Gaia]